MFTIGNKRKPWQYALCIDLALSGNFDGSTKEFDTGVKLERSLPFREFFENNLIHPRADAKAWLDLHRHSLDLLD